MKYEYTARINKRPRIKPKVVIEWEETDVFKLIYLVENEKCLWDSRDKDYHNKIVRKSAWQNINDEFEGKYTNSDLNAKWTNLRIQYRGYAGRAKLKSGTLKCPKWKFYTAMHFIGRNEDQQTQQGISNLNIDGESDSSCKYKWMIRTSKNCFANKMYLLFLKANRNSTTSTPPASTHHNGLPTRKLQINNRSSASIQIAEAIQEAISEMKNCNQNIYDPNINFANYLVSELKTLSEEAAASVRKTATLFFLQCIEEQRTKNRGTFSTKMSFLLLFVLLK